MKGLILKLVVLKIIQILILSQLVFAQNSSQDSFNDDNIQTIAANSASFGDENFRDKFRDNNGMEIRIESRDDGSRREFRQEFRDEFVKQEMEDRIKDGKYEFREMREVRYDMGPSYEGFNKEEMLFGRLFPYIEGEMDPAQIKQYCSNMDEMADIVISKIKAKIGEISNVCQDMGKEESECKERSSQGCSMMGQPDTRYAIDELHKFEILSGSCPVNSDAIKQACVLRMKQNMEDRLQYVEENCKNQWEMYGKQNQQQCENNMPQMICKEDDYIENCLSRYGVRKDNFEKTCPDMSSIQKPFCENGDLKERHNADGCITGYECVINNPPQEKKCAISNEEAERRVNDCMATKGTPEKIYQDGCVIEVKCTAYQCPYTEEQAKEKESACTASNGVPETKREGDCIVQVECHQNQDASGNAITGNVAGAFSSYDDAKRQCYNEWQHQKQNCENIKNNCRGQDSFVSECIAREKGFAENNMANIQRQCEMDSRIQVNHMERQCAMMDAERQRCIDESAKRCGMMEGLASECSQKVTEENFRNFIIREAEKRCKFMPFMEKKDLSKYEKMEVVLAVIDTVSEDEISKISSIVENLEKKYEEKGKIIFNGMMKPSDFGSLKGLSFVVGAKLNAPESSEIAKERKESIIAGLNPEKVVEKLLELSGSGISSEYQYIIEGEANDILEASESIDEVEASEESKGFAYKLKLFLGFAKDSEESEIKSLEASRQRLETSIKSLGNLAEEIPNEISKAILKEQVAELERQKEDIGALIKQKQKKANGLLRLFGLFG
ncbi:hypothetical protein HYW19_03090 [Candidatus Woesearchaeota archaeon]|nr:hypothetical protein [Candidatus Woesearchaeota archaeon]